MKRYPSAQKSQVKKIKKKKSKKPVKVKVLNAGFLKKTTKAPIGIKSGGLGLFKTQKSSKVQPLETLRPLPVPQISRSL